VTAIFSLSVAAGAMGVLGLVGVFLFTRYIPRLIPTVRPAPEGVEPPAL
jgi:hypothetical protein